MAKGLSRSLSRGAEQTAPIRKKTGAVNATLTMTGVTGVGWGTTVLSGLPEGNVLLLGFVSNLTFLSGGTISATWSGDYGVGTTPADDGTITAGDVDIIASTALGAATAGSFGPVRGADSDAGILDNTAGTLELNLNLLIDDADISANDPVTVTGDYALSYIVLSDD